MTTESSSTDSIKSAAVCCMVLPKLPLQRGQHVGGHRPGLSWSFFPYRTSRTFLFIIVLSHQRPCRNDCGAQSLFVAGHILSLLQMFQLFKLFAWFNRHHPVKLTK
jgi:hypothetical protein